MFNFLKPKLEILQVGHMYVVREKRIFSTSYLDNTNPIKYVWSKSYIYLALCSTKEQAENNLKLYKDYLNV